MIKTIHGLTMGLAMASTLLSSCTTNKTQTSGSKTLTLTNTSSLARNEVVSIDASQFGDLNVKDLAGTLEDGLYLEVVDVDADGSLDEVLIQTTLEGSADMEIPLLGSDKPVLKKQTQAELSVKTGGQWVERKYENGDAFVNVDELRVPTEHTDHSYYIRYEGPGWESDKVGYRFYLDWRNAIDIFGKKVDNMVLQEVGQDGFDSYHEPADWGMDILKAGKSLGIGSIGRLVDGSVIHFQQTDSVFCRVAENGILRSAIETRYYGWQTGDQKRDIISRLSICAGDRATLHEVTFDEPVKNFCTGIVKNEKGERFESLIESNGWAYVATFGPQSLAEDNLGLAIIYNSKDVDRVADSDFDHLVIFKPAKKVKYYLLGAWQQEQGGIQSLEEFKQYLNDKVDRLNNPITIAMN